MLINYKNLFFQMNNQLENILSAKGFIIYYAR